MLVRKITWVDQGDVHFDQWKIPRLNNFLANNLNRYGECVLFVVIAKKDVAAALHPFLMIWGIQLMFYVFPSGLILLKFKTNYRAIMIVNRMVMPLQFRFKDLVLKIWFRYQDAVIVLKIKYIKIKNMVINVGKNFNQVTRSFTCRFIPLYINKLLLPLERAWLLLSGVQEILFVARNLR